MIRCFKEKRRVFISVFVFDMHVRKFNLVPKSLSRVVSHRNHRTQVVEENLDPNSHPSTPENSNVNFLGIEGDDGVITVSSKVSCLQEKTLTKQLREKFYKTSYGIVRYDTDNKLKYHGQYGKREDFSFPHNSDDTSELLNYQNYSKNITEMRPRICDDMNKSSSTKTAKKSKLLDEKTSNEMPTEISSKDNGKVSYVDQFYFKTISEGVEKKNLANNQSTDELNYFDEEYFGHCTNFENESRGLSENINIKDKLNLKINSDRQDANNPSISSSTNDANFFDKSYFGESNVSINKKSCQMEEISQNTVLFNSSSSEFNQKNLSTKNTEQKRVTPFNYNYDEDQKSVSKSSSIKDMFKSVSQSNVNLHESFDNKQINVKDSDCDVNGKKFDEKILKHDDELNFDYAVENDLHLKENRSLSNFKRKNNQDLNLHSHDTKSNFSKLSESSQIEKSINNSSSSKEPINADVITAYDFVKNLNKQQKVPPQNVVEGGNKLLGMKFDSKGYRILKNQVKDLSYFTRDEILYLLKQSIIYQDDNLLILNKPYSLVIHDSQTTKSPCLSSFLEDLAKEIDGTNFNSKLVTVHRIDKETTGCLLLARNEIMAQNLQSLFAQRKITKKYWVLTSKVPNPPEGLIDIPISEGSVKNKRRMVLHPEIPKEIEYRNHSRKGKQALTSYKVLSESGNAALVEATPITGIKHQIRVHFGFGLSCPIIGDHKYSHLDKLAPQKLPSDILQRLHVRQSKVRYIPLHIHAKSITVPEYFGDRDLYIQAPLPNHIKENLKKLKFKKK